MKHLSVAVYGEVDVGQGVPREKKLGDTTWQARESALASY